MPRRFACLLLALAALVAPAAARACPLNTIWSPAGGDFTTSAAVLDTVMLVDPGGLCFGPGTFARYDIVHGTLYSHDGSPFGGCTPKTSVQDDFTLIGWPAGTPLALGARFDVTVTASSFFGSGTTTAALTQAAANTASKQWNIPGDFPGPSSATQTVSLTVPVAAIAGTPFHMTYTLSSVLGEGCTSELSGTFTFTGLPPGAAIVSCNGYVLGTVPARPTSWGHVKAEYR